jgi:hypothetical protein
LIAAALAAAGADARSVPRVHYGADRIAAGQILGTLGVDLHLVESFAIAAVPQL